MTHVLRSTARLSLGALLLVSLGASAQTRTDWQMHRGRGPLDASTIRPGGQHGNPSYYALAAIPAATDPGWGPAPNAQTIGFTERSQ